MSDVKVMSTEGVLLLNMSQINRGDNIFICISIKLSLYMKPCKDKVMFNKPCGSHCHKLLVCYLQIVK
jgi:hypothetical protein